MSDDLSTHTTILTDRTNDRRELRAQFFTSEVAVTVGEIDNTRSIALDRDQASDLAEAIIAWRDRPRDGGR